MTDVSIAIVTYHSALVLDALTQDLRAQRDVSYEVLFTDNGSTDGTVETLANLWPGRTQANSSNLGYTAAQRQNLARAAGRYVLFLNPDTRFDATLVKQLRHFLDSHPQFAIVGPSVQEGDRIPFPPRRFYPGEGMLPLLPGWDRDEIAWVNGCCLMIRREVLDDLGGPDPDFFLYQEETDLCWRARQRGHRIGWCPEATVRHQGKHSQAELNRVDNLRLVYQGNVRFWEKHYAPEAVVAMMRFQLLLCAVLPASGSMPGLQSEALHARASVCRDWIAKNHRPLHWPTALRIVARQFSLLWRWRRSGVFPLDDY